MKKIILSILLVMVLTMTACVANPTAQLAASEPSTSFSSNCHLAHNALSHHSTTVQKLGLAYLMNLSKSSLSEHSTYETCMNIFASAAMYEYSEEFSEIAKNIMENPHYDFVEKYTFFCNDDLIDKSISVMAFDSLLELAKDADDATRKQIEAVATQMYDTDAANKLLNVLETNY